MAMDDEERMDKTASEIWALAKGLRRWFEPEHDMTMFCQAVYDEFLARYPNGEQLLEAQGKRRI